jgi:hypothetical protein
MGLYLGYESKVSCFLTVQKLVLPDHDSPQVLTSRGVVLLGLPIYHSHIIQPILKILHMMHFMMGLQRSWPAKNKNEH